MLDNIIRYSINHKLVVSLFVIALIGIGLFSLKELPIDAVPDITNNQIVIITTSPTLATQEVEQFITSPIELSLQNLPKVEEIRSISRFGLSVITIVFTEDQEIYLAKQLVNEQLAIAQEKIPRNLGKPEIAPLSSGLGEIYQYTLHTSKDSPKKYTAMELRTIQDWTVKRQLAGINGVVEINSFGGFLKEYEVGIQTNKLKNLNVSLQEVYDAVANNNGNTGGSYIEKGANTYFIRGEGMVNSLQDIENIVIKTVQNIPILIKDVAIVQFGHAPRYGAMTRNGNGEVVGGIVMMLKNANSSEVTKEVKKRIAQIQSSLPKGLIIEPYLDRTKLVNRTSNTISKNLIEGGLIVVFVLVLLLGNFRAGLIVASVIPLAMLFAVTMMRIFGVSANLMSLGAIDFGLIVDGSVIIVESIIHRLHHKKENKILSQKEMNTEVESASIKIRQSAAFGEIIILMVYLPILALVDVEGKMFKPMAQTVIFAILGALILSLTYVPMISALFLSKKIAHKESFSDKIISFIYQFYAPLLNYSLNKKKVIVGIVIFIFGSSLWTFSLMGGQFIPTLEEGDIAAHQMLIPGSSLKQSVEISTMIQKRLMNEFPEIEQIVTKMGAAEIPTDPMPMEVGDIMIILKEKEEWVSGKTKEELFEKMEKCLQAIPGVQYEFTQPIQMRFNELMTGVRQDIAIKIYGENLTILRQKAQEANTIISEINGVASVQIEQTVGLPQILVKYNRKKIAQYGVNIADLNFMIETAFAGKQAGIVFEEEKRFDLVIRLVKNERKSINNVKDLYISLENGVQVPLEELATISFKNAPMQISRDDAKRRIVLGINARNRDTESLVQEIQQTLSQKLKLPTGYYLHYGGEFENLQRAKERLSIVVPIALFLIFILLYFTFDSIKQALLIFTAIPLSAIGGIFALYLRGMPFSISAGIGFIALFGVAVLNGIVLIGYFNQLKKEGWSNLSERIIEGTKVRLRPVIMTALVASLGFLPMAISNSAGAEVQKPLATVVIGGLLTATLLTLIVLPILYHWIEKEKT